MAQLTKQELFDSLIVPLAKRLYKDSIIAREFAIANGFKVEISADNVVKVNDRDALPLLEGYTRWEEYCPALRSELSDTTAKELKRLAKAVETGEPLRACWLWQGNELYATVGAMRQAEANVAKAKQLDDEACVLEAKAQNLLDAAAMLRAEASGLCRGSN